MNKLVQLILKHNRVAKFLIVGVTASVVHAAISWIFYYHIWGGLTVLSTLMGYTGGWSISYIGNRMWRFKNHAKDTPVISSASKFIVSQLIAMCVLLSSTWIVQQLIILYFWWYVITNHLTFSPELQQFSAGASYPPALLSGMFLAAICSYLIMRKFVFNSQLKKN